MPTASVSLIDTPVQSSSANNGAQRSAGLDAARTDVRLRATTERARRLYDRVRERMTHPQITWGDDLDLFSDPSLAGQPLLLRRAAAVRKVLLEMPIAIEDDDLIVGNTLQDGQVVRTKLPRYGTPAEYAQAASQGSALSAQLSHKTPFYYDILDQWAGGHHRRHRRQTRRHRHAASVRRERR